MLDMHNQPLANVTEAKARELIGLGLARFFTTRAGTKSRNRGIILTSPFTVVMGNDVAEKALSVTIYCGTRFIFRTKISTEVANFHEFRYKRLSDEDSPNAALARIMGIVRDVECPQPIRAGRASLHISDGSKPCLVRSADGRVPSTSPSKPPTSAIAA